MTGVLISLGICVAVLVLINIYWKKQYLFILTITNGQAEVTHGHVDVQFIEDVNQICKLFSVQEGIVKGVEGRKGINIICDGPIQTQQRAIQNAMNHPL